MAACQGRRLASFLVSSARFRIRREVPSSWRGPVVLDVERLATGREAAERRVAGVPRREAPVPEIGVVLRVVVVVRRRHDRRPAPALLAHAAAVSFGTGSDDDIFPLDRREVVLRFAVLVVFPARHSFALLLLWGYFRGRRRFLVVFLLPRFLGDGVGLPRDPL